MPLSRRRLLTSAGIGAAGIGLGAGGYLVGHNDADAAEPETTGAVAFDGEHQAGIATPVPDRLHFASFDLETESRDELRELMEKWTVAAREMTEGKMIGNYEGNHDELAPPDDTGEAFGLPASNLTITFGFGPSIFDRPGLGLSSQRPAALKPLPPLPGDELIPLESDGDICVQACADDPQVVFHAIRNLARIGRGTVTMRWSQLGFGRTSTTSRSQETPRNLFGMKDGTANIKAEDGEAMDKYVWVDEGPAWMKGGSYLVTRRIRMVLEVWDRSALQDQEETIGRRKYSGAPLGEEDEFDPLPLDEKGARRQTGDPRQRPRAARLGDRKTAACGSSAAATRSPTASTRASASSKPASSSSPSRRDPEKQFVALQEKLGVHDALNEYIHHVGSALFAVPGGTKPGGYVAESLFS